MKEKGKKMRISNLTNDNTAPAEVKRSKLNFKLREILNLIEIYQKEGGIIHRDNAVQMDVLKDFIYNAVKDDEKGI